MSAVPGHQDLFTDSCSFTLHSSTNTNYKGCSHVCACYLITVNKEFSLFSNSKEKTTSCDLLHGFATSHKVFSFCSRMYVEQPGKQPAPQESCGLPCPAPLQDENKPLQLFCPLFLAPLACSERVGSHEAAFPISYYSWGKAFQSAWLSMEYEPL